MCALTRRPAPTFFLRGCSRTRRRPPTSVCLWTTSRKRKLRRREGTRRDPDDSRILTGHNRPAACRVAYAAGGKCHHRDQRRANRERGWRLAVHGVAVGGTTARIGRESKKPTRRRILPGASSRYPDSGHIEATAEGQPFRETHLSFLQDGFDESRSTGIGTCGRARGRRRAGGRADRRTRPGRTQVAFRTRGGYLRDFASSAKTGSGTGSAANHDGRTLRAFRGAGPDGVGSRLEVAERPSYSGKKGGRDPDGDARRTGSSAVRDCRDWAERESGEVSRGACQQSDFPARGNGQ